MCESSIELQASPSLIIYIQIWVDCSIGMKNEIEIVRSFPTILLLETVLNNVLVFETNSIYGYVSPLGQAHLKSH